jgi:hypothetical protein
MSKKKRKIDVQPDILKSFCLEVCFFGTCPSQSSQRHSSSSYWANHFQTNKHKETYNDEFESWLQKRAEKNQTHEDTSMNFDFDDSYFLNLNLNLNLSLNLNLNLNTNELQKKNS